MGTTKQKETKFSKKQDKSSLLYYSIFVYLWKEGKSEYTEIVKNFKDISNLYKNQNLLSENFHEEEIYTELQQLEDMRVVQEIKASTYYDLNEDVREMFTDNEDVWEFISRDPSKQQALKILNKHLEHKNQN